MIIRAFREEDRAGLREVYRLGQRRLLGWAPSISVGAGDFDASVVGEMLWVAECNHKAVGFVSIWAEDNFIHNLFVHPHHFGRGIGTALLDRALTHVGRPATLKCLVRNRDAIRFYTSRGWQVHSRDKGSRGPYYVLRTGMDR